MNLTEDNLDVAACWDQAENINLDYNPNYIEINEDKRNTIIDDPSDYEKGDKRKEEKETKKSNTNNNSNNSSNDKGGKAGYSGKGKVYYLTKNGKNWNLNEHIQYTLNQGATSDGTYIYVVFKGDDSHAVIGKFDLEARKLIKKSEVMNLGHANDITYDSKRRKLFVTRRETNDLSIVMIDPNTFSHQTVNINIPKSLKGANVGAIKAFNGIAYDKSKGQLLIRGRYANSQLVYVNDNFKATKVLHIRKWFDIPTQGMELVNDRVIYSQSLLQYRSSVTSYSKSNGNKIKSTSLGVHGELEGVFYHNGYLYGITYDKSGKNKSLIYVIDKAYY